MNLTKVIVFLFFGLILVSTLFGQSNPMDAILKINEEGYYETPGFNVMVFDDYYPDGHQGGVTLIQCGTRIAANGDLRLEPAAGQWSAFPKMEKKNIDKEKGIITVALSYPDTNKERNRFDPANDSSVSFSYSIRTIASEYSIKIVVDLERPLPEAYVGKVGLNLDFFPAHYFGEHYIMDTTSGMFPRIMQGEVKKDEKGILKPVLLASGKQLVIAPGTEEKQIKIENSRGDLFLIDGRTIHNNGWFVLRSLVPAGLTKNAIVWTITPKIIKDWRYQPAVHVSQIGYHPKQTKFAVIELDKLTKDVEPIQLIKISEDKKTIVKMAEKPAFWGKYLRYNYLRFDFSDVAEEGIYQIKYGKIESNEFEIRKDIYSKNVWQPTLETFLPVQMCHMKVKDRYRVWHGLCHMDDALMAPTNYIHFDGYSQKESTFTKFTPGEHVPGLNVGGWHDAGDDDLRIESQAETVYKLALIYEIFKIDYDATTIDQKARLVELHKPDGKPDIVEQIEHGVRSIVGGYDSMGRLYRGIISSSLEQYIQTGDISNATDNLVYKENEIDLITHQPLKKDDRLVFTERNPRHELQTAKALAAAYRVLKQTNPELAWECLNIAASLFHENKSAEVPERISAASELYLSTTEKEFENVLRENIDSICKNIIQYGDVIGRAVKKINDANITARIESAVKNCFENISGQQKENPFGVQYKSYVWGDGWQVQSLGVKQLFLHLDFPKYFPADNVFNALNFILGVHPGENTDSFVSGVGVHSLTTAYGLNRDDWSFIPGGVASGTALIRPDLPELKVWPYLWQQTEYVMGGGTTDFLLLAIAADKIMNK